MDNSLGSQKIDSLFDTQTDKYDILIEKLEVI